MRIRLLRHGETEYNRDWKFLGQTDLPLTKEGAADLFACREKVKRVYTSGLTRTMQTAQILFPGAEYIAQPELNEMDFGTFEGKSWIELKEDPDFQTWIESERFGQCPGGEGRGEFSERVCNALAALVEKEKQSGEDEITIVAHGGTVMAAMERFCTDRPGQYTAWRLGNGEGYLLECSGAGENMEWHVIKRLSYNRKSGRVHLYFGEGRGKTSIAMGTALRALQQGYDVRILQFCKNAGSGETLQLEKLGATVVYGKETPGFVSALSEEQKQALKERQTGLLKSVIQDFYTKYEAKGRLLVLDEVCAALQQQVLDESALWDVVVQKTSDLEIIMTGRYPAEWLQKAADYATELKEVAHPYHDGLSARKGIEA